MADAEGSIPAPLLRPLRAHILPQIMLTRLNNIGDTVATATAAGTLVLAQTGVEPWIPLILTIINGIFLALQGRKASKKPARPPVEERQTLPPPVLLSEREQALMGHATSAIDATDYAPK